MKRLLMTTSLLAFGLTGLTSHADAQEWVVADSANPYVVEDFGDYTVITATGIMDNPLNTSVRSNFTVRVSYNRTDFSLATSPLVGGTESEYTLNDVAVELSINGQQWLHDIGGFSPYNPVGFNYRDDLIAAGFPPRDTTSYVLGFNGFIEPGSPSTNFGLSVIFDARIAAVDDTANLDPLYSGPGGIPDAADLLAEHAVSNNNVPFSGAPESFAIGFNNWGGLNIAPGAGDGGLAAFGTSGGGGAVVPEPATWAMMLAGFGLAGLRLTSRRRAAA